MPFNKLTENKSVMESKHGQMSSFKKPVISLSNHGIILRIFSKIMSFCVLFYFLLNELIY